MYGLETLRSENDKAVERERTENPLASKEAEALGVVVKAHGLRIGALERCVEVLRVQLCRIKDGDPSMREEDRLEPSIIAARALEWLRKNSPKD